MQPDDADDDAVGAESCTAETVIGLGFRIPMPIYRHTDDGSRAAKGSQWCMAPIDPPPHRTTDIGQNVETLAAYSLIGTASRSRVSERSRRRPLFYGCAAGQRAAVDGRSLAT